MHYWEHTSLEIKRLVRIAPRPLLLHQDSPVLHLSSNAHLNISSRCARPPSSTGTVLCHGAALPSTSEPSGGSMYALVQLTSSFLSHRHHIVPSVSSPVSIWSYQCRLCCSCKECSIPHWTDYPEVMYSLTLVNIKPVDLPRLKNDWCWTPSKRTWCPYSS